MLLMVLKLRFRIWRSPAPTGRKMEILTKETNPKKISLTEGPVLGPALLLLYVVSDVDKKEGHCLVSTRPEDVGVGMKTPSD